MKHCEVSKSFYNFQSFPKVKSEGQSKGQNHLKIFPVYQKSKFYFYLQNILKAQAHLKFVKVVVRSKCSEKFLKGENIFTNFQFFRTSEFLCPHLMFCLLQIFNHSPTYSLILCFFCFGSCLPPLRPGFGFQHGR